MTIEVTLERAIAAHRAFTRIGTAELPPKAAYRVARLIAKLRSEELAFNDAHAALLKSKGGKSTGAGAAPPEPPKREKDETDEAFAAREEAYKALMVDLTEELVKMSEENVKIEYDPIPLTLFEKTEPVDPSDPKARALKSNIKPNDLADVLDFVADS